jgi:hypothetical protein
VALCESRGRLQFYAGPEKARGCFNERRIVSNESPPSIQLFSAPSLFPQADALPASVLVDEFEVSSNAA